MKSEFEKLLKQHRDALTDELVKLGNYRQAQLIEWDIERNETDYEFYFNNAWNVQQSKIDELQCEVKRINLWYSNVKLQLENKEIDSAIDAKKIDELQKRVDATYMIISQLNNLDDEAWKRWKREACTFSQGESNAYEHSARLLEQALKGNN